MPNGGGSLYPWAVPGYVPDGALQWPQRTGDASVSLQPIISDYMEGNGTHDPSTLPPPVAGQLGWGHFYGGSLQSVNVGFADAHVEPAKLENLWTLYWHKGWVNPATRPR